MNQTPVSLSVLDIFKIGVGPSSSHTMGPMNAARQFALDLARRGLLDGVRKIAIQLYGSLALTGRGHCTDRAVLLGLEGMEPATLDPESMDPTASTNFGKLTNVSLQLTPSASAVAANDCSLVEGQTAPQTFQVFIRGLNFNIVRCSGGALGLPVL